MMQCRAWVLLLVLCVLVPRTAAQASDEAPEPAAVARDVQAAEERGDAKTLSELARRPAPDPFLVADALRVAGASQASLVAFARAAAEAPAGAGLPALVQRWGELSEAARAGETERRACLERLQALSSKEAYARLAEIDACLAVEPQEEATSVASALLLRLQGLLQYEFNAFDASIAAFARYRERAEALGSPSMQADATYQQGRPAYMVKDYQRALALEQDALARYRTLKDWERVVYLAASVGMCHVALSQPAEAEALYRDAVRLAEEHHLPVGGSRAALFLGGELLSQKQYIPAAEALAQGAAWARAAGDTMGQLRGMINRGVALQRARQLDAAATQYAEALPIAHQLGSVRGEAIIEGNLAFCTRHSQRPTEALRHATRAVALYEQLGTPGQAAPLAMEIALIHLDLGDVEGGATAAERAIEIATASGSQRELAKALLMRATVRLRAGDPAGVLVDGEAARAIAVQIQDAQVLSHALTKMGFAHERQGQYRQALPLLREALAAGERADNAAAVAEAANGLGHVQWALRDFDGARASYEKAAAIYERQGLVDGWITVLHNLAGLLNEAGLHEEAHGFARRANAALGEQSAFLKTAGLIVEACTLINLKRYEEAEQLLLQAQGTPIPPQRALVVANLAYVNMHLGRLEQARVHARAASDLHRRSGGGWELAGILETLAGLEANAGDDKAALEAAREAVTLRAGMSRGLGVSDRGLLGPLARSAEDVGLFAMAQLLAQEETPGLLEEALWMAEMGRSLALLEGLVNRDVILEAHVEPALEQREREAAAAVRKAQQALLGLLDQRDATAAQIEAAEGAFRSAEAARLEAVRAIQRDARHAAALTFPTPVRRDVLEASLAPNEAFVLYHLLPDGSVIALVATRRGTVVREIVPYGEEDIRPDLKHFRTLVSTKGSDDRAVASALFERLVRPIADRLEGVERLLLSPDGELAFLPFEALVTDAATGARLLDRYDVAHVPSATVLTELRSSVRPPRTNGRLLALGDPDYGVHVQPDEAAPHLALRGIGSLGALPHSGKEVEALARLYGEKRADVLLREKASVKQLMGALESSGPLAALHLACHGIFVPEHAQLSGLVLAGREVLTLEDLFRMRVDADMVVLSACESGQGHIERGEGVIGLVRGFLFAGAPRVLVSNWNVQDDSTMDLMVDFHTRVRKGVGAARALREAKRAMRNTKGREHPYYWAPFVLWGLPE